MMINWYKNSDENARIKKTDKATLSIFRKLSGEWLEKNINVLMDFPKKSMMNISERLTLIFVIIR